MISSAISAKSGQSAMWLATIGVAMLGVLCGEAKAMNVTPKDSLFDVVQRLVDAPRLNRQAIEQAIGAKLQHSLQNSNSYFEQYEIHQIAFEENVIGTVSYSEPGDDAATEANSRVLLSLRGACIGPKDIQARYLGLETAVIEPDGGLNLYKNEKWGVLSFGFSAPTTHCLSYVRVDRKRVGQSR